MRSLTCVVLDRQFKVKYFESSDIKGKDLRESIVNLRRVLDAALSGAVV